MQKLEHKRPRHGRTGQDGPHSRVGSRIVEHRRALGDVAPQLKGAALRGLAVSLAMDGREGELPPALRGHIADPRLTPRGEA